MKIAIVDYGMGNLASVHKAFEDLGAAPFIARTPRDLSSADRTVLPGVGAFGEGMTRLHEGGWVGAFHDLAHEGRPLLGICLGMQLLADMGDEGGENIGLGLIRGRVLRLDALGCQLRIPHVGWNEVDLMQEDPLFAHIPQKSDFYFVHSFALQSENNAAVLARTDYGIPIVAAVRHGFVYGTQFHPEKSSKAGRMLLQNFLDLREC